MSGKGSAEPDASPDVAPTWSAACWSSGGRPLPGKGGKEMKIRHPRFVGLVAALAVSLASIVVSAVAAETPFKGTVSAVETGTVVFPDPLLGSGRHGHRHVSRQVHGARDDGDRHSDHVVHRRRNVHCGERRHLDSPRSSDRRPGRVPPRSRSSRSTPSPAERDASPTRPAASRWTSTVGSADGRQYRHARWSHRTRRRARSLTLPARRSRTASPRSVEHPSLPLARPDSCPGTLPTDPHRSYGCAPRSL